MTHRNRIWACVFSLCLMITALLPADGAPGFAVSAAQAEEKMEVLDIRMSAKPAEMVEPGDTMLSFTIINNSGSAAQNVYLSSSDGLFSEPIGQLAAGETQNFNRQHSVTQDELDEGKISYIISHDDPFDPAGKVNYTVSCSISRGDILPRAEFTRQLSSRYAAAGSTLTITYRIRNMGNVALTNLRVQDSLGDYTGRVERLEVGESRTLISRATITEDCVSSVMLDYNAEGMEDELFTQSLEDISISLAQSGMEAIFSASPAPFSADAADAILILQNIGNVDIRDIRIADDIYGGIIADGLVLYAGSDPIEVSHSYPVRGDAGYRWQVIGVSEAGETIDYLTETAYLPYAGSPAPAELSIEVYANTPRIRRSGNVTITLHISNGGGSNVQNVMLSEAAMGELHSFAVIPANDGVERSFTFDVQESSTYNFSLNYTDENGVQQSITCAPVEITIAPDGVLPEGAKQRFIEFTGHSIKIGGSSTFAILLIAGCAVLLVLIIMLIIASRRARIEKQLRIAAQRQRRREEQGKTNRLPPVRASKNRPKGRN